MRNQGQFRPVARSSELLAEGWTIIILPDILTGCRTFNEIADGAPLPSRGLLSKRLRELQRRGDRDPAQSPTARGRPTTPPGRGGSVMPALQTRGSQWTERTPERAHPGLVSWSWVWSYPNREELPKRRALVRFDFATLTGAGSLRWLLVERGDAELCETYPGGEEELVVEVDDTVAFARRHLGEPEWGDALRSGASTCAAPGRWPVPFPPDTSPSHRPGASPASSTPA